MKLQILCALSLALMVGCNEVEDRLTWSPNSKQAALNIDGRLYLMDASGKLTDVIASNVTGAAWLPDSSGLVLTRLLIVDKWAEAERLLPAEDVEAVKTIAKGFLTLDLDAFEDIGKTKIFEARRAELISPAMLYLFDTQSNALHEALRKCREPDKRETDFSNVRTTGVYEVSLLLLPGNQIRVIERSLTVLLQALPSPKAPVIAFAHGGDVFDRGETLTVAPLDGSTNRIIVTDRLLGAYGWAPDGKSLVYADQISDKDNKDIIVAGITDHLVVDTNAALIAGQKLRLSINASTFKPRVKCLTDGRALFSGQPLQLPSPAAVTFASRFYLIDPSLGTNAAPVAIPVEAGSLPQDLAAFTPSPDVKRIAIVESGSDAVAVLDVATGAIEVISPKRNWKSKFLPAWRGTNELYFAALPSDAATRPELFLWRKGSAPQAISTNWPDAIVMTLLQKPEK